jgi:hypothetical protein
MARQSVCAILLSLYASLSLAACDPDKAHYTLRPNHFYGVWGSGPSDIWVAGENGLIARWNGAEWVPLKPAQWNLRGIPT